jgi:enoyl-CoA hydratase/carnithine racemase
MATEDLGTRHLRMEHEGHIAVLTIDRPNSRNALSRAMYFGIKRAVAILNAYPDPTALIITGVDDVFAPGGRAARP